MYFLSGSVCIRCVSTDKLMVEMLNTWPLNSLLRVVQGLTLMRLE